MPAMPDDPHAMVELLVEIRQERPASYGVKVLGDRPKLLWLPRAEVSTVHRQAGGAALFEIPRWLAEKEGLIEAAELVDPNQGVLL